MTLLLILCVPEIVSHIHAHTHSIRRILLQFESCFYLIYDGLRRACQDAKHMKILVFIVSDMEATISSKVLNHGTRDSRSLFNLNHLSS